MKKVFTFQISFQPRTALGLVRHQPGGEIEVCQTSNIFNFESFSDHSGVERVLELWRDHVQHGLHRRGVQGQVDLDLLYKANLETKDGTGALPESWPRRRIRCPASSPQCGPRWRALKCWRSELFSSLPRLATLAMGLNSGLKRILGTPRSQLQSSRFSCWWFEEETINGWRGSSPGEGLSP